VNFDFSNPDIGMNDGVLSNDQHVVGGDRSMKVTVQANQSSEL
jgi:hypothetical protein